jgi:hypothetical protein
MVMVANCPPSWTASGHAFGLARIYPLAGRFVKPAFGFQPLAFSLFVLLPPHRKTDEAGSFHEKPIADSSQAL